MTVSGPMQRAVERSDQVEAVDPQIGQIVALFNPRTELWTEHFSWDRYTVIPLTATGRATAAALHLNHARRLLIRQAEELFGLFPPIDA